MSAAVTPITNGVLQGDLDCGGHKLLNVDLTDIISDEFGVQTANRFFAGPSTGVPANPTFRAMVAADLPATAMLTTQNLSGLANLSTSRTNLGLTAPAIAASSAMGLLLLNIAGASLEGKNFLQSNDGSPGWVTPGTALSDIGAEAELGNPGTNGFVLSSTTSGVRSWVAQTAAVLPTVDSIAIVKGSVDQTKRMRFDVSSVSSAATRVLTVPNFDGTLATLAGIEAFTNKSYNGILLETAGGSPLLKIDTSFSASGGEIALIGKPGGSTLNLPASGTVALLEETEPSLGNPASNGYVLSSTAGGDRSWIDFIFTENKAVVKGSSDPSKLLRFEVEGFTSGVTRVLTPPDYDGTIATLTGTEILANKTLEAANSIGIVNPTSGFDLNLVNGDIGAAADRNLSINLNNANRSIQLGGNLSLAGSLSTLGAFSIALTATAATELTLPTTGTIEAYVGVPASAAAAGIAGQKAYDANFEYRCIASGNWVRSAHATWP